MSSEGLLQVSPQQGGGRGCGNKMGKKLGQTVIIPVIVKFTTKNQTSTESDLSLATLTIMLISQTDQELKTDSAQRLSNECKN